MGTSLFGLTPAATYPSLIKFGDNSAISGTLRALSDGLGTDLPIQVSTAGVNFTGTASIGGTAIITNASGVSGAIQFSNGSAFASDATNFFWDNTNKRLGVGLNTPATTLDILPPVQTATATQFDCMRVGYSNSTIGVVNGSALQVQVATTGSSRYSTTLRLSGSSDTSQAYLKAFSANNFGVMLNRTNSNLGLFSDNGIKLGDTVFAGQDGAASAMVHIKGSGSTSATTSLLVQNSAGTAALTVKDDLSSTFGGSATAASFTVENGSSYNFLNTGTQIKHYNGNSIAFQIANTWYARITQSGSVFGSDTINASAALEVVSTTKGFLPPRMTTAQINAIVSPAEGLVAYNTTISHLCCYQAGAWVKFSHSPM